MLCVGKIDILIDCGTKIGTQSELVVQKDVLRHGECFLLSLFHIFFLWYSLHIYRFHFSLLPLSNQMVTIARNLQILACLVLAFQSTWANIPFEQVKFHIFDKQMTPIELKTLNTVNSITDFFSSEAVKSELNGDLKTVVPYSIYLDILLKINEELLNSKSDWLMDFKRSIDNGIDSNMAQARFNLMESVVQAIHEKIPRLDETNQLSLAIRKSKARYVHSNLESLIDYFAENGGIFKQFPFISAPLLINVALMIAVFTPIGNQLIPDEVKDLQLACKAKDALEFYRNRVVFLRANRLNSMDLYYEHMAPVLTQTYNSSGYDERNSGIFQCKPGCRDDHKAWCLVDEFGDVEYDLKTVVMVDCISEYVGLVRHRTEKLFPVEVLDNLCVDRKPRKPTGKIETTL